MITVAANFFTKKRFAFIGMNDDWEDDKGLFTQMGALASLREKPQLAVARSPGGRFHVMFGPVITKRISRVGRCQTPFQQLFLMFRIIIKALSVLAPTMEVRTETRCLDESMSPDEVLFFDEWVAAAMSSG